MYGWGGGNLSSPLSSGQPYDRWALVSRSDGPFHRGPMLATSGEEIVSASGSHYDDPFSIVKLGSITPRIHPPCKS